MQNPFESLPSPSTPRLADIALEDYLERLCAPLVDQTTYEQRLAIREEVRTHILGLATAHIELGSSPAEALQAAMQQFGDAKQVGRSLAREYPRPFVPNASLIWGLMHALIGSVSGAITMIALDCLFKKMHLTGRIELPIDCMVGLMLGWIPGLRLWRHPSSPLKAGARVSAYYCTAWAFFCLLSGIGPAGSPHRQMCLVILANIGFGGALCGAALSSLFRRLKRFAPRSSSKSLLAR